LQYCIGYLTTIGEERGMARLIMGNLMTFDGFVEGPNRDSAAK
jgi:hypothetical protein